MTHRKKMLYLVDGMVAVGTVYALRPLFGWPQFDSSAILAALLIVAIAAGLLRIVEILWPAIDD